MTLLQIKSIYLNRLLSVYSKNESDAIFYLVAQHLLNYSKIDIHSKKEEILSYENENKLMFILNRLLAHEPVQYILGKTEFYNLPLSIDSRALIPRQETELLVDIILKEQAGKSNLKIIDLCTGSGCIAISLASNLTNSNNTATDISKDALDLAMTNAKNNNVSIFFIKDSILNPLKKYDNYDLIVSNPPYVRESERHLMAINVIDYEPHSALFVNDIDPLIFYLAIAKFGKDHLNPDGSIYTEINELYGCPTKNIFLENGLTSVHILKDLNNKDRFIKASFK
jgi:release factor glutamine methyltransferase